MKWFLLIAGILSNAGASIMVKWISGTTISITQPFSAGNVRFGAAILLYFGAFLFYSAAVTRLPLAVAHPVMTAGAMVLVGLSAVVLFHETLTALQIIGYSLLLAGIVCIALSRSAPL